MQYYIIFAKDIAFKNFEMYSQIIASAVGLDDATLTLIFQVPLVTIVPFKFDGLHFKRWPRRWCQKNLFKEEYSYISIDYKNIENTIKEKLITKFKKRKKINNNKTIKNIINIKNLSIQAFTYLKNQRQFNSEMDTNLLNIKENNNIVNKINVIFKKKENMKKIYI